MTLNFFKQVCIFCDGLTLVVWNKFKDESQTVCDIPNLPWNLRVLIPLRITCLSPKYIDQISCFNNKLIACN